MRVKELIEALKKHSPEAYVYVGKDMTTTTQASVVKTLQSFVADVQSGGSVSPDDEQSDVVNEVHILGFYPASSSERNK